MTFSRMTRCGAVAAVLAVMLFGSVERSSLAFAEGESAAAAVTVTPPHIAGTYDTGSIAWMLVSAALVFLMMPGLALFYGGMVRAKNLLNMFMLVMVCVPLITLEWVAYGYSMAFAVPSAIAVDAGKDAAGNALPAHSYLGWDPSLVFMKAFAELGVDGPNAYERLVTSGDTVAATPNGVPELLFAIYQMMFAIITPSTTRSVTGSGTSTAGCSKRACSTLPAARWFTCSQACRPLPSC